MTRRTVTGDEALLLAEVAPTWTGANRAASARAAIAAGAEVLLMDDGLQNPSLEKTMALLVVDGSTGFGNGRVMPAGPLREPVLAAANRCRAAVLIGQDTSRALAKLPRHLPVLRAGLTQGDEVAGLRGRRVMAFAGIGVPAKFFDGLEQAGVPLVAREGFADHHAYTRDELARLTAKAQSLGAILVTTPKDAVRLPDGMSEGISRAMPGGQSASMAAGMSAGTRAGLVSGLPDRISTGTQVVGNGRVVSVRLMWEDEAAVDSLLNELLSDSYSTPPPRGDRSVA